MVVDRLTAAERRCRSRRRCKRQCDQQRREAGSEQQRETLTMSARHAVFLSVSDLLVASPAHLRSGADQSRYRRFARAEGYQLVRGYAASFRYVYAVARAVPHRPQIRVFCVIVATGACAPPGEVT